MARYPFLSEAWFVEVRRLHENHADAVAEGAEIRMNLMIKEVPGRDDLAMNITAAAGRVDWGEGHLDEPNVTLTLGYDVAKEILVEANPQAAIEAFMVGKITVQGDITKLMIMQAQPGPGAPNLARALQDITE